MKTSAVSDGLPKLTRKPQQPASRHPVAEFTAALCSVLVIPVCLLSAPAVVASDGGAVVVATAYSASDAAATLSGLTEGHRQLAIASMVRNGQLPGPLSAADGALVLSGTSQGYRSASIGEMAPIFKADLTGQEGASILGSASALNEGNRHLAIAALARAKRFGPTLGGDAGLILDGTTQGSRAAAIGEMAPYLRTGMRGDQIAAILGSGPTLSEGYRHLAIAALARAGRMPQALTASEAVPILIGTTQGERAAAIREMARNFATGLSGEDTAAILGGSGEMAEGNRYMAIAALARAGKLRPGLSGQEMTLVLEGISGQTRVAAISEIVGTVAQKANTKDSVPVSTPPSTETCKAPYAAMKLKDPSCLQRWQTVIFRRTVPPVFGASRVYIDKWQAAADTGASLVDVCTKVGNAALFLRSLGATPDATARAARVLVRGNTVLLNLGLEYPEETIGLTLTREAVNDIRGVVEASVTYGFTNTVNPLSQIPNLVKLANNLLRYANTVRYTRLTNTYTLTLEYLRLLYHFGGDQAQFAQSLGLLPTAPVQDCIIVVNRKYGFSTNVTSRNGFNPSLAEKLISYWTSAVADLAAIQVSGN